MYVVIDGGGKVGSFLATTLSRRGHDVAVVERRPDVITKLVDELPRDALIIQGDGVNAEILREAGIEHADVFVAATGEDDDNLVACQLAKLTFNVSRTVARVNNPKNERIFHAMGIEAISSTTVIARLIEEEATVGDIITLYTMSKGKLALVEVELPTDRCVVCNKKVSELGLPRDTVLVTVVRGEEVIVPKGDTMLKEGDSIIAVTSIDSEEALRRVLRG
ncbi:MAG: TrkA family potassium uptake protein [Actinobacteria bacterium]|nr:MAG: TrkA family potassium uptake protein [Actinomycetota bacterium]